MPSGAWVAATVDNAEDVMGDLLALDSIRQGSASAILMVIIDDLKYATNASGAWGCRNCGQRREWMGDLACLLIHRQGSHRLFLIKH